MEARGSGSGWRWPLRAWPWRVAVQVRRWGTRSGMGVFALGACCALLWAGGVRWPALRLRGHRGGDSADLARLKAALRAVSEAFHGVFTEFAQMVISVKKSIANKGLRGLMDTEDMAAMLLQQGFQQKLEDAEAAALRACGMRRAEFARLSAQFRSADPEVAALADGLRQMSRDAANGVLPLLPGAELHAALAREDATLAALAKIQAEKLRRFKDVFDGLPEGTAGAGEGSATAADEGGGTAAGVSASPSAGAGGAGAGGAGTGGAGSPNVPPPALNTLLMHAATAAEEHVLAELGIAPAARFHHAIAVHSRSETFCARRAVADDAHSDRVVRLMREKLRRQPTTAVVLHDRLERVTANVFQTMMESLEEGERAPAAAGEAFFFAKDQGGGSGRKHEARCEPRHEGPRREFGSPPRFTLLLVPKPQAGIQELDVFTTAITDFYAKGERAAKKGLKTAGAAKAGDDDGCSYLFMDFDELEKCSTSFLKDVSPSNAAGGVSLLGVEAKALPLYFLFQKSRLVGKFAGAAAAFKALGERAQAAAAGGSAAAASGSPATAEKGAAGAAAAGPSPATSAGAAEEAEIEAAEVEDDLSAGGGSGGGTPLLLPAAAGAAAAASAAAPTPVPVAGAS